eukprot:gene3899-7780_t
MSSVVIDNGGGILKFGWAGEESPQASVPNCIAKVDKEMQVLVADEIDSFFNGAILHYTRPFDRGFLLNWQCEIEIWQRIFSSTHLNLNTEQSSLVITEAPFTPEALQNEMNEVIFEDFQFLNYLRRPATWFSAYEFECTHKTSVSYPSSCLVIDSGFSFTHSMPFTAGKCLRHGCKRINIGGKLLTNYLKEVVSYRQWNMMDEFRLMNQVKEGLCFVTDDIVSYMKRIERCGKSREDVGIFVLPDYQSIFNGYVMTEEDKDKISSTTSEELQMLALDVERPSVPEILFRPSDSNVGIGQAGVAEAVELGLSVSNVILTGGNVKFPGFKDRFYNEFRPLIPDFFDIEVFMPVDPSIYAWQGASRYASSSDDDSCTKAMVSRKEYLEYGHSYCNKKMDSNWKDCGLRTSPSVSEGCGFYTAKFVLDLFKRNMIFKNSIFGVYTCEMQAI